MLITPGRLLMRGGVLRTNLLRWSEAFDNAVWSKQATGTGTAPVVTAGAADGPDGSTLTADEVVFALNGGTASTDRSEIAQNVATVVGMSYAFSVWLKTTDGTTKAIRFDFGGGNGIIRSVTGTWTRFSHTLASASNTTSYPFVRLRGTQSTADSASVYMFGAQFETGTTVTAYIPTAASTASAP